jgi:hypothetical protein
MNEVVFLDTMNDSYRNPTLETMRGFIFEQGDDFWDMGSGSGAIEFYQNNEEISFIHLKGLEEYGFMIDHKFIGDKKGYVSLRHGEHTGETVEATIGGNPNLYYREHFVPKEMAWEAIEYFLKTGDRKPDLTWEIAEMPDQEF